MQPVDLADWVVESMDGEMMTCEKGQVYVLSVGTKSFTWVLLEGVMFSVSSTKMGTGKIANTIWRKGWIVHSLDENIMLACHTLTECKLYKVNSEEFNEKVRKDAELSWALAHHYHNQFTNTLENYRHAGLDPSKERIRDLEKKFASIEELNGERISDSVLSLFTGMHRVSINRLRNQGEGDA